MGKYEIQETDVLVVGGGGAGLRAAIAGADEGAKVVLINKGQLARSSITVTAQWSFQAAFAHEDIRDSPDLMFGDIVVAGRYLGDQNLVEVLARDAVARALDLERYKVRFTKKDDKFVQTFIPGQTFPRSILLEAGGYGMVRGLIREVERHKDTISVIEDLIITKLLTYQGEVVGAVGLDIQKGEIKVIKSKSTVLATGGYQQLWPVTDNPPDATGDGFALAYSVGADLVDMEMMLWYPVVAVYPECAKGVIVPYEVVLEPAYAAGRLIDAKGEDFLPPGRPPVRDIMIRLIFKEIIEGRGTEHNAVSLDLTKSPKPKEEITKHLEAIIRDTFRYLLKLGVDIREQPIEIAPTSHYVLGGIRINERAETTILGLYAAGECVGNIHGANRLSGAALTDTQVFGAIAGKNAAERAKIIEKVEIDENQVKEEETRIFNFVKEKKGSVPPSEVKDRLREVIWRHVSFLRNEDGLRKALNRFRELKNNVLPKLCAPEVKEFNVAWMEAIEASFMLDVAEIITRAALSRKETRGHHIREDYPETEKHPKHTIVRLWENKPVTAVAPVIFTRTQPR